MMWRQTINSIRLPLAALALAVPLAVTLPVAAPASAQAQVSLATIQRHLGGLDSMTADFRQTDRAGKVLTGTMTMKKPGRIRFQYQSGVPFLIVADGRDLYYLDYQVRQQQRWPIGDSPLSVLLNPNRDMSGMAKIVPSSDPRLVTVEAFDPKRQHLGRITLIFARNASAPDGLMLQGWVALDGQNNRTTVRLSNHRFNVPVADRMFRWTDPRRGGRPG